MPFGTIAYKGLKEIKERVSTSNGIEVDDIVMVMDQQPNLKLVTSKGDILLCWLWGRQWAIQ